MEQTMPESRDAKLTPHFKLSEFLQAGDPMPPPWVLDNFYRLANRLQVVRDLIRRPLKITSAYRTPSHNADVGGHKKSLHLSGMAVDVVVSGLPPKELQLILVNWTGGMGLYETHTHLDIRPYRARWRG